jgi:hypothetical protein
MELGHGGGIGARLCFAWCAELPGNAVAEKKLKTALSHFPKIADALTTSAQAFASVQHARRAELVDSTGDGQLDALAVDTVGDGVVDTMIHLADLDTGAGGLTPPGGIGGGAPPRRGSTTAGGREESARRRSSNPADKNGGSKGGLSLSGFKMHPLFGTRSHLPTTASQHEKLNEAADRRRSSPPNTRAQQPPPEAEEVRPPQPQLQVVTDRRGSAPGPRGARAGWGSDDAETFNVSPRRSVGQRKEDRDGFLQGAIHALGLGGL